MADERQHRRWSRSWFADVGLTAWGVCVLAPIGDWVGIYSREAFVFKLIVTPFAVVAIGCGAAWLALVVRASIGPPGRRQRLGPLAAALATTGVMLAAGALLTMLTGA